jgi:hypothetical protein
MTRVQFWDNPETAGEGRMTLKKLIVRCHELLTGKLKQRILTALVVIGCLFFIDVASFFGYFKPQNPPPIHGLVKIQENFKNFTTYWISSPVKIESFHDFLTADGNPAWMNFWGHGVLSLLLTVIYLIWGAGYLNAFITGSLINILHEYVVEGVYFDPSFTDLWIDQAGLVCAILIIFLWRKRQ